MSEADAALLGISAARVAVNTQFFESYANTTLAELAALEDAAQIRDDAGVTLRRSSDDLWVLRVDAASALREAAHWAAVLDPLNASSLMERSGDLFLEADALFGNYLVSVAGARPRRSTPEQMAMLKSALGMGPVLRQTPEELRHPQQQAYLLLEMAADPEVEVADDVVEVCVESGHRKGAVPVGALGAPIRHFWIMAEGMARMAPDLFMSHYLAAFGDRYRAAMGSARSNEVLWQHGATGADLVDPEALGLASLASQRFGVEEFLRFGEQQLGRQMDDGLGVVLRLGAEMAAAGSRRRG